MNNISYKEKEYRRIEKVKMTAPEFKYLVGLLPHDIYWGDPLTPQLLKEILDNFKSQN